MAALILPSRRVVQPQGPVQIDFGNPLCRGISEVITTEGVVHRSVISGAVHAYAGVTQNPAISARFGFGGQNYANGSPTIKAIPDTSDATIFAAGRVPNQTNLRAAVQLGGSSSSIPSLSIDIGDGTTAGVVGGRAYLDGTRVFGRSFTLAIGSDYAAVARQKKGVQQDLWVNGFKDPTTTAFTAGSAGYTHFGRPGSESYGIPLFLAIAWNRALSDSEIRAISENPWQIFKPIERRIWVPVSGGGGAQTLSPSLLTRSKTIYEPTVIPGVVTVSPGLLTRSKTIYAPTVAQGGVTLSPSLLTRSKTLHAPSVSVGPVAVSPPLLTRTKTLYEPVVSQAGAPQIVAPGLLTRTKVLYSPVVVPGEVDVAPPLLTRTKALYAPTLSTDYGITAPLLTRGKTVYAPTITVGGVTLTPPLLTRSKTIYFPTLTGGDAPVATGGLFWPTVRRRRR